MQYKSSIEFLLMRRIFSFADKSLPDSENLSDMILILEVREI